MHKITEKQRNNLLEAARLIEANPERFDMSDWICGTTACIAGYAMMVEQKRKLLKPASKWFNRLTLWEEKTAIKEATGLDRNTFGQRLFLSHAWFPCDATNEYMDSATPEEEAKAAADYVRWFVENHTTVEQSK